MDATSMLIGGQWRSAIGTGRIEDVTSPYDGSVVGTVPVAGVRDVEAALAAAEHGASVWRRTPAHERMRVLMRAADLAEQRTGEIAKTLSAENGKTITEATAEAGRSGELIRLAAFEGTQLYGDSLPLDANPGTGLDKVGFTLRQPCGIVVAITPFNYPALLVLHKLAPALAAGNAVVLKPARTTPLTALALAACFVDAGLPEGVLSVLTGPGGELGDALVSDPRVRKVSFTGSTRTGERITRMAGVKKLSLELGASCPVVVLPDADLELAASAVAVGGYVNAGQVCISVQRVITHPAVSGDFLDALVPRVQAIRTGDPSSSETTMGSLVSLALNNTGAAQTQFNIAAGSTLTLTGAGSQISASPTSVGSTANAATIAGPGILDLGGTQYGVSQPRVQIFGVDEFHLTSATKRGKFLLDVIDGKFVGQSLNFNQHARRILNSFLNPFQEAHGFTAIHDAMIVRQGDVHHWTDEDLPFARNGPFLDGMHSQNTALRRIDDGS